MRLLVKAKYVDPSQLNLFSNGDVPKRSACRGKGGLVPKKVWVKHSKTGKLFQKTVWVKPGKEPEEKKAVEDQGEKGQDAKPQKMVKQDTLTAPGVSEDDIPYDLALKAHYFSSMDPGRRAQFERAEYVDCMNHDYTDLKEIAEKSKTADILDKEFARYREGYKEKVKAYLFANSRTASSMVTGSGNFPVERNRRRMETAHRRSQEVVEFREKALNAIKRKLQPGKAPIRSGEADTGKRLSAKLGKLQKLQEAMKAANKVVRSKVSDADKIRRMQEAGLTEDQAKQALVPDYMGRQGFPPFTLRGNNAQIKRLKERLE